MLTVDVEFFSLTIAVWKSKKFSLTKKSFRQINSLVLKLFSKTVTFTKYLPKMREREFPQFPHCDENDDVI